MSAGLAMERNSLQPTFSNTSSSRLPTELWATIFEHFYDMFFVVENSHGPTSLHPTHPLQVISNVCHTWQVIIESLPILWAKIVLKDCWKVPKKDISAYISTKLCILSNILRRSRHLPLQITILAPRKDWSTLIHPFMLLLAEHSHRWTYLTMHENRQTSVNHALNSAITLLEIKELPSLEMVCVNWSELRSVETSDLEYSQLFMMKLPKLRKVRMIDRCFPQLVPLDDLKEVEFHNVPVAERWAALCSDALSSVETILVTDDESDFTPFISDASPYTMPALERLVIQVWETGGFSPMTAPHLRELVMGGSATAEEMQGIISFIERSKCLLSVFSIRFFYTEDDTQAAIAINNAMTALLRCLPAVETLQLGPGKNVEALANALSQTRNGRWVNCPSLEHLEVYYHPNCTAELLDILIAVIEQRWQLSRSSGIPGLRKVEGFWRQILVAKHSECLRRLEVMAAEGLCVMFRD